MNPFVVSPDWHWWIIFYFFLGGLSAGVYLIAALIDLVGSEEDRPLARLGYRLAFPLIGVCGILLIVDLERPDRFWHMMFQSEVVHEALEDGDLTLLRYAPLLKWWSPMSIGAWALGLFGACTFLSFFMTFWPVRFLGDTWFGHLFRLGGSGMGFFVASYTGVLLSATNQPIWSISDWIAPLFLTSAASTSISVLLLLGRGVSSETRERLEKADLWALSLELFFFLIFLASLGNLLPSALRTAEGIILVFGTLVIGLLIPLALHLSPGRVNSARYMTAAFAALIGGFLLRYGIVMVAPALLELLAPDEPRELARKLDEITDIPLFFSGTGAVLILAAIILAGAIPLLLRSHWHLAARQTAFAGVLALLMLIGVFFYSLQPLAERRNATLFRSPEDHRERGGGVGASLFNRPDVVRLRSKFNQAK
jgi:protein NrfD